MRYFNRPLKDDRFIRTEVEESCKEKGVVAEQEASTVGSRASCVLALTASEWFRVCVSVAICLLRGELPLGWLCVCRAAPASPATLEDRCPPEITEGCVPGECCLAGNVGACLYCESVCLGNRLNPSTLMSASVRRG